MMTFFGLPGVKAANDDYPAQCTFASSVSYGFRAIVPNLIRAATCWEDPYLQYALHFCDLVHRRAQLDTLEVKHHAFRRVFFDDVILDNIRWELFRLGWRRSEMEAYFEAELACREANHAIVFGEESQEGCQQCKEAAYDKILALTLNIGPAMWTMPFARELKVRALPLLST